MTTPGEEIARAMGYDKSDDVEFEVRVPRELSSVLGHITDAYMHRGKAARAAFVERLEQAIPAPHGDDPEAEHRA